jgi:hypothetical protein
MPRDFLIAIPAWGEWYAQVCTYAAARSVRAATTRVQGRVRLLVYTDRRDFLRAAFRGLDVEFRVVVADPNAYIAMGNCHRDALANAAPGEIVILMCADQVISGDALAATESLIAAGKRAIFCAGPRVLARPVDAPAGADAACLLQWALAHRHPWTRELIWATGHARALSLVYFEGPDSVAVHGFHLHPFAVLNDRPLTFHRPTLDCDLVDCFTRDEIHVVTQPDELSTIEISPAEKMIPLAKERFYVGDIAAWAHVNASPMHRWLFEHRIVLSGDGEDCGDTNVIAAVREHLEDMAGCLTS